MYANNLYATCQFAFSVSDPLNYEEATKKEGCNQEMVEEMKSIENNGTWEMMGLSKGKTQLV